MTGWGTRSGTLPASGGWDDVDEWDEEEAGAEAEVAVVEPSVNGRATVPLDADAPPAPVAPPAAGRTWDQAAPSVVPAPAVPRPARPAPPLAPASPSLWNRPS